MTESTPLRWSERVMGMVASGTSWVSEMCERESRGEDEYSKVMKGS